MIPQNHPLDSRKSLYCFGCIHFESDFQDEGFGVS